MLSQQGRNIPSTEQSLRQIVDSDEPWNLDPEPCASGAASIVGPSAGLDRHSCTWPLLQKRVTERCSCVHVNDQTQEIPALPRCPPESDCSLLELDSERRMKLGAVVACRAGW